MLKVEHVTFRYERRGAPVLRDASLSLETGQVGVLLGRNGCGKTTLLKTTLGLCTPEQGQILFDGQALGAMKRQQRAQVAAYVPQELQFGALRVYDAVLAGPSQAVAILDAAGDIVHHVAAPGQEIVHQDHRGGDAVHIIVPINAHGFPFIHGPEK